MICLVIVMWVICGFKLAFNKARRGQSVVWIGGTASISKAQVTVESSEVKATDLMALTGALESAMSSRRAS